MNYSEVTLLCENSPAIRLLRRRENAPVVIAFLFRAFKDGEISGPRALSAVTDALDIFLQELKDDGVDPGTKSATLWLRDLTSDESGLLRTWHHESTRDAMVELTADAERILTWLQSFVRQEHVGVESKVREIWRDLEAIVEMATDNPDARLIQLDRQIEELQQQRQDIIERGHFERASERAINEAYTRLNTKVRELPGDFREVEDRLRKLARDIGSKSLDEDSNRGFLLGFALDTHEALASSPQGQSVDGFLDMLRPPNVQDDFDSLVDLVYAVKELAPGNQSDQTLRQLFPLLGSEARRVQRSRQRLVSVLQTVLNQHRRMDSMAITTAIKECRASMNKAAGRLAQADFTTEVDSDLWLNPIMTRGLWQAPVNANLGDVPPEDASMDHEAIRSLLAIKNINLDDLADNIRETIKVHPIASLAQVVRLHPPSTGVVEVLGYILLAYTNTGVGAVVDESQTEVVEIGEPPQARRLRCPLVVFGMNN